MGFDTADDDGMRATARTVQGARVLAVSGVIDMVTAPVLTAHLRDEIVAGPAVLIVDLTEVELLSSAGLEALVTARNLGGKATSVVIVADGPGTSRPIRLTGLDELLPVYAALPEALSDSRTA